MDHAYSSRFSVTLRGNRMLANPRNLRAGESLSLTVTQDRAGSRTLSYDTLFVWAGGSPPRLSTGAGHSDLLTFSWDGTRLIGSAILDIR